MDAVKAFSGPRYSALYGAWQAGGDAALMQAASTILPDAVSRERGRLDCVVLSRQYPPSLLPGWRRVRGNHRPPPERRTGGCAMIAWVT